MENSPIHQLLAKYFEGNTSLQEERIIQEYFNNDLAVPEDLLPLKKQFALLKSGRNLSFDTTILESKILAQIEEYEKQIGTPVKRFPLKRFLIAASITLVIALSGIMFFRSQNNRIRDTFTDPHLAYAETQKALLLVSRTMNKGIEPLSNISKINSGTEQLKKLEKIDQSLGMLNLVSFINQSSNLKK
jgi:hypothetical protein